MLSELCPIYIHILVLFSLLLHGFFFGYLWCCICKFKKEFKKMLYNVLYMYLNVYDFLLFMYFMFYSFISKLTYFGYNMCH